MVIDSSAALAIILQEPTAEAHIDRMLASETRLMSVANFVEIGLKMVFLKGTLGLPEIELFVMRANIELVAVDEQQAYAAIRAFEKYGKGRHPAALNYGDCLAYALAKLRHEPLLYQGNDFSKTDLA